MTSTHSPADALVEVLRETAAASALDDAPPAGGNGRLGVRGSRSRSGTCERRRRPSTATSSSPRAAGGGWIRRT
jgi:hypothetical protein